MDLEIRPAHADDAVAVSAVILRALHETNAGDYPPGVIERVAKNFGPADVAALLANRQAYVAVADGRIVGTASLDGGLVRTVFVAPDAQGQGVGRRLMAEIERAAREAGVSSLSVPSSITAEPFYARLGFRAVRDRFHGDERIIIMERDLG